MPDTTTDRRHRSILRRIARRAMQERGLLPDFSPAALAELEAIGEPASVADAGTRDLRDLIWCSIDNDDSRDLDQLTVAQLLRGERNTSGQVAVLLAPESVQKFNGSNVTRVQSSSVPCPGLWISCTHFNTSRILEISNNKKGPFDTPRMP